MDVQMPLMDGIEATSKITEMKQKNQINSDIKVIILTAFSELKDKQQAFEAGACAYLTKPIIIVELQNVI